MNTVEKVMVERSSHVKLAAAVAPLVLVLWVTGSPVPALWMTPIIICGRGSLSSSALDTAIATTARKATARRRRRALAAGSDIEN